jgi:hypothetical protein
MKSLIKPEDAKQREGSPRNGPTSLRTFAFLRTFALNRFFP